MSHSATGYKVRPTARSDRRSSPTARDGDTMNVGGLGDGATLSRPHDLAGRRYRSVRAFALVAVLIALVATLAGGCAARPQGRSAFTGAQAAYLAFNKALLNGEASAAARLLCSGATADTSSLALRTAVRDPAFVNRGQDGEGDVIVRGVVVSPADFATGTALDPSEADEIVVHMRQETGEWCVEAMVYVSEE